MKNVIKVLLIGMISLVSVAASASTIVGKLNMGGVYKTPGADLLTMTEFDLDSIWASNTPDFDPTIDMSTVGDVGTPAKTVSLDSFTPVGSLFTIAGWTFDLESLSVDKQLKSELILSGTGLLYTAKDDKHAVNWSFSSEALGSYSMSVTAVPVPAAVWLFGTGLIGLVGVARRKA